MEIDYRGRQTGKTTKMVLMLKEHPKAAMMVRTHTQAKELQKKYPDVAKQIYGPHELDKIQYGSVYSEMWVDQAETFLNSRLRVPITRASFTKEKKNLDKMKLYKKLLKIIGAKP